MDRSVYDFRELLEYIDPAQLTYTEWISIGMALHKEGYTAADWDTWSRRDSKRYRSGECFTKWGGFHGAPTPVTGGTIVQMAKEHGWRPPTYEGYELDWNDLIGSHEDHVIINENWVESREIAEPAQWDPAAQLILYLETLFDKSENVGYVCESWEKEGRYLPTKGMCDRTAGELIEALKKCKGDIGAVLGDYRTEAGAWIRFNPLDGTGGVKNENVTALRYALVESDDMPIDKQHAIIHELELPVACLVHSGGKSLHAIVRIEAAHYDEYRKRVDYLYKVCQKNGLKIDSQNRNPSRLSRLPGAIRNGRKQFIVSTHIGKTSWAEWQDWIEGVNDDLPQPVSMAEVWDNMPPLSPPLIDGLLRQGHKMLLAGPSKAGKSFALIELCCAIAEGRKWLGWPCTQGRVLYVNLELDEASCFNRFKDVYDALGWEPNHRDNIHIWNLRGRTVPMDKLAPKLIRRAQKKNYIAIVIDPIYKVITGDENSADQMAQFCNQFDRVCFELGAAVIYCHHHSKGQQGQKRSMDRASGSGVFARDPDALLDLIELELTEAALEQESNKTVCAACCKNLNSALDGWEDKVGQDDMLSSTALLAACKKLLAGPQYEALQRDVEAAKSAAKRYTGWRIDATLREFPKCPPVDVWFTYPVHRVDDIGVLKDIETDGGKPPWVKAVNKRKLKAGIERKNKLADLETAINACNYGDPPTKKQVAEYLGVTERSVFDRIKAHGGFIIDKNKGNVIVPIEKENQ